MAIKHENVFASESSEYPTHWADAPPYPSRSVINAAMIKAATPTASSATRPVQVGDVWRHVRDDDAGDLTTAKVEPQWATLRAMKPGSWSMALTPRGTPEFPMDWILVRPAPAPERAQGYRTAAPQSEPTRRATQEAPQVKVGQRYKSPAGHVITITGVAPDRVDYDHSNGFSGSREPEEFAAHRESRPWTLVADEPPKPAAGQVWRSTSTNWEHAWRNRLYTIESIEVGPFDTEYTVRWDNGETDVFCDEEVTGDTFVSHGTAPQTINSDDGGQREGVAPLNIQKPAAPLGHLPCVGKRYQWDNVTVHCRAVEPSENDTVNVSFDMLSSGTIESAPKANGSWLGLPLTAIACSTLMLQGLTMAQATSLPLKPLEDEGDEPVRQPQPRCGQRWRATNWQWTGDARDQEYTLVDTVGEHWSPAFVCKLADGTRETVSACNVALDTFLDGPTSEETPREAFERPVRLEAADVPEGLEAAAWLGRILNRCGEQSLVSTPHMVRLMAAELRKEHAARWQAWRGDASKGVK